MKILDYSYSYCSFDEFVAQRVLELRACINQPYTMDLEPENILQVVNDSMVLSTSSITSKGILDTDHQLKTILLTYATNNVFSDNHYSDLRFFQKKYELTQELQSSYSVLANGISTNGNLSQVSIETYLIFSIVLSQASLFGSDIGLLSTCLKVNDYLVSEKRRLSAIESELFLCAVSSEIYSLRQLDDFV